MTKKKVGSTYSYWSPEEDEILARLYPLPNGAKLVRAELKNRTIPAIHGHAVVLGIKACPINEKEGWGKGPTNKGAKVWQFENKALGVVLSGTNLQHLVLTHRHLFDEKDINHTYKCGSTRATMGLRGLSHNPKDKSKVGQSWKGWVFLRKSEKIVLEGGELP